MMSRIKKWVVSVPLNTLALQERKDTVLFLTYLNVCGDYDCALDQFKQTWLNTVYELPQTSAENYQSVKTLRGLVVKRIKTVYQNYIKQNTDNV